MTVACLPAASCTATDTLRMHPRGFMFATITAIVMAAGGLGLGSASLVISSRAAAKQRSLQAAMSEQVGLVAREVVKHSAAMAAVQDLRSSQVYSDLAGRLDGLEFVAAEQLITRDEVSMAFAELARIEEQRLRQQQSYGVVAQPAPAVTAAPEPAPPRPTDPWSGQTPPDPTALIKEIAQMNERLKQRLQGGSNPS